MENAGSSAWQAAPGAGGRGDGLRELLLRLITEVSQQTVEDTVRTVEESTHRWMEESLSSVGECIRRMERSIHEMDERQRNSLQGIEERLNELNRCNSSSTIATQSAGGDLEEKVKSLERSVDTVFQSVLPRLETLINQLNGEPSVNMMEYSPIIPTSNPGGPGANLFPTPPPDVVPESARENSLEWFLIEACKGGRIDDVKRLLDAGVNIDTSNLLGLTNLHFAVGHRHPDIVQLLLSRGADVHARTNFGCTALHVAAVMNCRESITHLLNAGADLTCRDTNGWTPLHWAATKDSEEAIRMLLAAGSSPDVKDNFGMLPLDLAGTEAIRKLLRQRTNV